jgi:mannose/fructose/N-acetylgalactosamine-specific phosphotransferase system component IIC
MTKFWKFFEIGYLIIAIVLIYETISRWNSEREKAYLFLGFSVLAIFMYFFKKRFRKKVEARNNDQKNH